MKDNSIYYNNIPIKIGWLCPKCEHVLSPYLESCPYCEVAHKENNAEEYLKEEFEEAICYTCKHMDIKTVYASNPLKYMCKFYNKYEPLDREACDQYEPVTITSSASINSKS